jgi:hypothetical protein
MSVVETGQQFIGTKVELGRAEREGCVWILSGRHWQKDSRRLSRLPPDQRIPRDFACRCSSIEFGDGKVQQRRGEVPLQLGVNLIGDARVRACATGERHEGTREVCLILGD